jgi:hypothetical protein
VRHPVQRAIRRGERRQQVQGEAAAVEHQPRHRDRHHRAVGQHRSPFTGTIPCRSGQHGFAVRVLPRHGDLGNPYEPGLVTWG